MRGALSVDLERVRTAARAALQSHPGKRPTVSEIAGHLGCSAGSLRRGWRRRQAAMTIREIVTSICIANAIDEIRRGCKVEAAMVLAGFNNRTNFNRQFRKYAGELPGVERQHAVDSAGRRLPRRA